MLKRKDANGFKEMEENKEDKYEMLLSENDKGGRKEAVDENKENLAKKS